MKRAPSNLLRPKRPAPAIDRIDAQILAALQNNGRLSNKQLAALVALSPSSCLMRVRRLQQSGALKGVHAEIEPAVFGIGLQAMLAVRLRRHARTMVRGFRAHVLALPEVVAAYNVAGSEDFLVHVVVRDTEHLYDLELDAFAGRHEVDRIQSMLIFDAVRRPVLPDLRPPPPSARPPRRRR